MTPRGPAPVPYVALGDSYTIGTAIDPSAAWPSQLVAALAGIPGPGVRLELVANLAVDGRTSQELIDAQLPGLALWRPGIVSVLIGVNDVVRGVPTGTYEENVRRIVGTLLGSLAPDRIVTVGIPDYTVTPRGAEYGDPARQSAAIVAANTVMAAVSAEHGIRHVAVFDLSRLAADDRTLVADDGLHPSAVQYALWVERIAPVVAELFSPPRASAR